MKPKRHEDREFLDFVKTLPCIACGQEGETDPHHVTTVGAGGGDTAENVMPLCREHHQEWHARGPGHMAGAYPSITTWLHIAGRRDVLRRIER